MLIISSGEISSDVILKPNIKISIISLCESWLEQYINVINKRIYVVSFHTQQQKTR